VDDEYTEVAIVWSAHDVEVRAEASRGLLQAVELRVAEVPGSEWVVVGRAEPDPPARRFAHYVRFEKLDGAYGEVDPLRGWGSLSKAV